MKVVTCGQTKPVLVFYTGVLKFTVSVVLLLVVIKSPCGVQMSYCPYPKFPEPHQLLAEISRQLFNVPENQLN